MDALINISVIMPLVAGMEAVTLVVEQGKVALSTTFFYVNPYLCWLFRCSIPSRFIYDQY